MCFFHLALVSGITVVPLNSTSVRVSWTPVNLTVVDHYTVHYTTVGGVSGFVSFPATSSSGVVSGLQAGKEFWFSVTVTLNVSGELYSRSPDYRLPLITCKHPTPHASPHMHHIMQFVLLLCGIYFMVIIICSDITHLQLSPYSAMWVHSAVHNNIN